MQWAVAQRAGDCTDAEVEDALSRGAILRTHVLRPTWHLVAPADIRWMLALTAPRVHALNAPYYRQTGLDAPRARAQRRRDRAAVQGGRHLTRDELRAALRDAGIPADGLRLALLLMHAELEAIVCNGPRRGKQLTYAALDERAPAARALAPDEALAELARRYFTGHGPARAQDFAWWSGLRVADAQTAIATLGTALESRRAGDDTFWAAPGRIARRPSRESPRVHLLPSYDEYVVAYRNHAPIVEAGHAKTLSIRGGFVGAAVLTLDGRVAGSWRRTLGRDGVTIQAQLLIPLAPPAAGGAGARSPALWPIPERPVHLDVRGPRSARAAQDRDPSRRRRPRVLPDACSARRTRRSLHDQPDSRRWCPDVGDPLLRRHQPGSGAALCVSPRTSAPAADRRARARGPVLDRLRRDGRHRGRRIEGPRAPRVGQQSPDSPDPAARPGRIDGARESWASARCRWSPCSAPSDFAASAAVRTQ